jgi:hypothetical protein
MGKLFDELKEMKATYDRKLQQEGEAAVKDAFKDLFDKFPEVRSVVWSQYTPYFNDGDVCYFSVHEFDVNLGTDDSIKEEIEAKKQEMKAAADAGEYKTAQQIKNQVDKLMDRLGGSEEEYNYGEGIYSLRRSKNPREVEIAEAVRALQRELPSDVLESVFGDHAKIVATRQGFKVSEQSHD